MRKIVFTLLFLVITFTYSAVTYGSTTFSYDNTIRRDNATYQSGEFYGKARNVDGINFSYIKRIKIDIDYQWGKYRNSNTWLDMELSNIQVGLRVVNHPKQLIYFTAGGLKYTEHVENIEKLSPHEAEGSLIGIDYVGILTDKLQIELNFQKSLKTSSQFCLFDDFSFSKNIFESSAELDIYKIKLRYLLTDNFGLTINFRWMDLNIKAPLGNDVEISNCSLGFVYRF
ncbi:MAG: hypothetical protein ACM3YE_08785 [Bacteroidota bacterium]